MRTQKGFPLPDALLAVAAGEPSGIHRALGDIARTRDIDQIVRDTGTDDEGPPNMSWR